VKSYTELRNGIASLFESTPNIEHIDSILDRAGMEIDDIKLLASQEAPYAGKNMRFKIGRGDHASIGQSVLGETPVTPDEKSLVTLYNAKYYPDGVSREDEEDDDYKTDVLVLNLLQIDISKFSGRQKYSERVMRILLQNRNPFSLAPTTFNEVRILGAINTAVDNLVESGALPASAISNILNKATYMNDVRGYINLRVEQDETLFSLTGSEAVEFLFDDMAIFFSEVEADRMKDTTIPGLIDDQINAIAIRDETLQHQGAISDLKARKDEMVTKILIEKANHEQIQDMLEDEATLLQTGHKRTEFDVEAAIADLVTKIWRPLEDKSLASVKADADKAVDDARRLREANDAAVYLTDQENVPGWAAYKNAAQLAWTAQGKDPTKFSEALMQRFTDNASDPNLALNALSRHLFESGAFGITTPEGTTTTTSLKADFTALLEGQATKEKSLKILGEFSTVEMAIASPRGRAALEAMAPGLSGGDQADLEGLEAQLGLVMSDPASAQEFGTEAEIRAEIDAVKARPAARFKAQLDQPRTMPGMMGEAQFGYDTGGVEISQEVWANALAEKEKMRMALDVEALMAGVEEWQKDAVYEFLGKEGGLEMMRSQYEMGFTEPDAAYYSQVAKAREAAGLVGVDTDESFAEWDERTRGEPDFVDPYPELTKAGTYEVEPGVTVTIPEGGKREVDPGTQEPGDYSRRLLFSQAEASERQKSQERRKARGETFQKFMITSLPEAMKARTARIAGFKGSKLVRGTATTGRQRVRF